MRSWVISLLVLAAAGAAQAAEPWRLYEQAAERAATLRDWSLARTAYKKSLREAVRASDADAVRHLKKQIARLPADPAVIERLIGQERYDEAFKRIKAYLNLNPSDVWAMCRMGEIYETIGRDAQAERLYKHALAVQPGHPTPHYFYARFLLLKKKDFDQALQEFKRFRDRLASVPAENAAQKRLRERQRAQATRWIASIWNDVMKNPEEALRELQPLAARADADVETIYDYGVTAFQAGRRSTAYGAFQRILRLHPQGEWADRANAAIDALRSS